MINSRGNLKALKIQSPGLAERALSTGRHSTQEVTEAGSHRMTCRAELKHGQDADHMTLQVFFPGQLQEWKANENKTKN